MMGGPAVLILCLGGMWAALTHTDGAPRVLLVTGFSVVLWLAVAVARDRAAGVTRGWLTVLQLLAGVGGTTIIGVALSDATATLQADPQHQATLAGALIHFPQVAAGSVLTFAIDWWIVPTVQRYRRNYRLMKGRAPRQPWQGRLPTVLAMFAAAQMLVGAGWVVAGMSGNLPLADDWVWAGIAVIFPGFPFMVAVEALLAARGVRMSAPPDPDPGLTRAAPAPQRAAAPVWVEPEDLAADIAAHGWESFKERTPLTRVAQADDPGNVDDHGNPHKLTLYRVPTQYGPLAVVEGVNGTPLPDGTRERFGIVVEATHTDPVAAIASTWGVTPDVYAQLTRRT